MYTFVTKSRVLNKVKLKLTLSLPLLPTFKEKKHKEVKDKKVIGHKWLNSNIQE